jgi:ATP-dependent Clp protease adapter protein ClpS
MDDISSNAGSAKLFIHYDEDTPPYFVKQLVRTVFGKPEQEAIDIGMRIQSEEKIACGPYPAPVAKALLDAAEHYIDAAGHDLQITSEIVTVKDGCDLCGARTIDNEIALADKTVCVCNRCLYAVRRASENIPGAELKYACVALDWHFAGVPQHQLVARSRQFPGHMRTDVQVAIDRLFVSPLHFFGIHEEYRYETLTFSSLMKRGRNAPALGPPQFHDVDIGETQPVSCLYNGFWLCTSGELRFAVLLSAHREYDRETGIRIEIAVPAGEAGDALVQRAFAELEQAVYDARSYRGKILSLEGSSDYGGRARGVTVHRLPTVGRDEVILPEETLRLLDRNAVDFVGNRAALRKLGQSTRKGILLYGPPGTGKTHTIRYLATNLPGHTTLIITAEQMGLLGAYMNLARLLQPATVVIEDVDLIARDREKMGSCEEPLLNKLLNEMDGLKGDADILFVLTTNRPEQLEGALAGRPGRIDQAIEVPLPDEIGREKLVRLYGKGLSLNAALVDETVRRTNGVSAAFIKELMRRIAQASILRDGGSAVEFGDISEALDDMLFTGGRLNVKLLGGAQQMADS